MKWMSKVLNFLRNVSHDQAADDRNAAHNATLQGNIDDALKRLHDESTTFEHASRALSDTIDTRRKAIRATLREVREANQRTASASRILADLIEDDGRP